MQQHAVTSPPRQILERGWHPKKSHAFPSDPNSWCCTMVQWLAITSRLPLEWHHKCYNKHFWERVHVWNREKETQIITGWWPGLNLPWGNMFMKFEHLISNLPFIIKYGLVMIRWISLPSQYSDFIYLYNIANSYVSIIETWMLY